MGEKRRLSSNIFANVLQAIVSAALLFALYRYINIKLGVEQLGVWSVVLATISASRLVDLGLSAGVIRFVARDCARGEFGRAARVVDTVALTLLIITGVIFPLLYPLLAKLLPYLFQTLLLEQALAILPYALVSLLLTIIAAVFQGGLDGCRRMDLRAGLVVAGQCLLLILAFWLVPQYGLIGLAWAQVGQSLFLMIGGRLLLCRTLPTLSWLPQYWNKDVLREMLGYGANLQAATVFMMLFDPVTKVLMARFGGVAAAGYFEMANQVVLKTRAIIVAANQAIVPHVAAIAEDSPTHLSHLYRKNLRAIVFVSLPAFSLLIVSGSGLSWLLTGGYQPEFIFLLYVFVVGWLANIITVPAYFCNMGIGRVGWNTLSHVLIGLLNLVLGWFLGSAYGMIGVALGYAIAIIVGSFVLIGVFQYQNGGSLRDIFAYEHIGLAFTCLVVGIYSWDAPSEPIALLIFAFFSSLLICIAAWLHPFGRQIVSRLGPREK